jgi:hypothetical protein
MDKGTLSLRWSVACVVLLSTASLGSAFGHAQQLAIIGTYDASVVIEGQGTADVVLVVKQDDEKLTAASSGSKDLSINGITVDGEKVTLTATWQGYGFELPGTVTAEGMGGKWGNAYARGTWSAKKRAER